MSNLAAFFFGVTCGILSVLAFALFYSYWFLRKERRLQKVHAENILKSIKQDAAATKVKPTSPANDPSVKDRLNKAIDITIKQGNLNVRGDNERQLEYNNLELEKLNILRTILADGFDPPITIRYSTGDQEMLLSNYVANLQKTLH